MLIGAYQTNTPFATAGSGNARWCVAFKDGKQYFLKQFLSPVQPIQTTQEPTEQVRQRRIRCAAFEERKMALYQELKRIVGDSVVHPEDFFVHDGHYFIATGYIDPSHQTFETVRSLPPRMLWMVLYSLAECLRTLHVYGIVHADLKPEHIIVQQEWGKPRIRLIDFDSGFLESDPPKPSTNIDVDPVYMAPEAYRLITGDACTLTAKLDTFAFGILLHQALTGELPSFDRTTYDYCYACVLDGGKITLSPRLSGDFRSLIRKMLRKNPAKRPGDCAVSKTIRNYL